MGYINNYKKEAITTGHEKRLEAIKIQLTSSSPGEVWRGLGQIKEWLQENLEDHNAYGLLLDVIRTNPALQEKVSKLLEEMIQQGSNSAKDVLQLLPVSSQDLIHADDEYYAAEYGKAIALYRKVLQLEPNNQHAKQQLDKAMVNLSIGKPSADVPRKAVQYYRQARSYISAKDYTSAVALLNAAVEEAHDIDVDFAEANALLDRTQELLTAEEYKVKAENAIKEEQWELAIDLYNKASLLDSSDTKTQYNLESLSELFRVDGIIKSLQTNPDNLENKLNEWIKSGEIKQILEKAERSTLVPTSLYRNIIHFYVGDLTTQLSDLMAKVKHQTPQDDRTMNELLELIFQVQTKLTGSIQKNAYKKLKGLLDKDGNVIETFNVVKVVMQEIKAELAKVHQEEVRNTWPWRATAIGLLIFLTVLVALISLIVPKLSGPLSSNDFVFVLAYFALIGSGVKVARYLSLSEAINLRKSLELLLLRPIIGLGVALITILSIKAGFIELNVKLGTFVYLAISVIMGYSQPLADTMLNILDGNISFKTKN